MGDIVHVFRSAGEVNELLDRAQFVVAADFLLQKIFDSLDVVIGGGFDGFDALGILDAEILRRCRASADSAGTSVICGWLAS